MKQFDWRQARAATIRMLTHGFALFGLASLIVVMVGPHRTNSELLPEAQAAEHPADGQFYAAEATMQPQQRVVASYLARRYRVASDAIGELVRQAYAVGQKANVDPLLILAVMAIESRFNPIAESGYGAKGLMQVVPRFHSDKLSAHGGDEALLEPRVNIQVGVQILKNYIRQAGSLESGLQLYAGAADDPESRYAQKVMAEQARLRRALRSTQATERTDI